MLYAVVEIVSLLLLAGLIGIAVGFGIGYVRTAALTKIRGRQRAKADLRHRLLEAKHVIAILEQTASETDDEEEVFTGGIRLSERVARARAEADLVLGTSEIHSDTQPVA